MDSKNQIQLSYVELKNFRCFSHLKLDISSPYVLLEGANGAGKTSILEALYFACYLRSFRTHSPRELVSFNQESFFVKVGIKSVDDWSHNIQIGFAQNKRVVKVDQRPISSYKDLMAYYRVISLTENDLTLIQGSPQFRRLFLDQMLLLLNQEYGQILKSYRQIVNQRNAFLQHKKFDHDTYLVLTQQLWSQAQVVKEKRVKLLTKLSNKVKHLCDQFIAGEPVVNFTYIAKRDYQESCESFLEKEPGLLENEKRYKRSLFGAHLDDILIELHTRHSRIFASRGQQKLILLLLKIAQICIVSELGHSPIFLLDDFMTDFDENRSRELIESLESLLVQLVFTSPVQSSMVAEIVKKKGGDLLKLTM